MHTQERQFTFFLYFTTDLQRRPKPNWTRCFSQNRTELEKSIPHISSYIQQFACAGLEVTFSGNPGHGSGFIQNNAAEKMVGVIGMLRILIVMYVRNILLQFWLKLCCFISFKVNVQYVIMPLLK